MCSQVGVPGLLSCFHLKLPACLEKDSAQVRQKANVERREEVVKSVVTELSEIHEVICLEIRTINICDQLDNAKVHGAP